MGRSYERRCPVCHKRRKWRTARDHQFAASKVWEIGPDGGVVRCYICLKKAGIYPYPDARYRRTGFQLGRPGNAPRLPDDEPPPAMPTGPLTVEDYRFAADLAISAGCWSQFSEYDRAIELARKLNRRGAELEEKRAEDDAADAALRKAFIADVAIVVSWHPDGHGELRTLCGGPWTPGCLLARLDKLIGALQDAAANVPDMDGDALNFGMSDELADQLGRGVHRVH